MKNYDFQLETIKVNPNTKWERIETILTWWGVNGKQSMPVDEDDDVNVIIEGLKK